jgi:glycosyltransferase involved in cell wall biosynthesis
VKFQDEPLLIPEMIPLISVLMATYNDEPFLEEAILSVLNQTYANFEFIIVDDNSNDATVEILQKYVKLDDRIKLVANDENIGLAGSLNKGLNLAQGEWIARMDGDDISKPDRFEIQMKYILENGLIYLGTGVELINKETGKFIRHYQEPLTHGAIAWKLVYASAFIHATTIGRKDVILDVGGYNSNYRKYEDADLWRRLIFKGACANLPDSLYTYRTTFKPITNYMEDIIVSVHQAYFEELIHKNVSREMVLYLYNSGSFDPATTSIDAFEIVGVLMDAFNAIKNKGWFVQGDYIDAENQFWKLLKPLPARSEKMIKSYGNYYWRRTGEAERDNLYWEYKKWPRTLKLLGLLSTSPRLFYQKIISKINSDEKCH